MAEMSVIQDNAPFLASTGVTVDVNGVATVTGAVTMLSKKFDVRRMASISLFVQGSGGATGVWKILACNDYDPTRPVQKPGTFVDVTADFGAAGASTPPGVHNFAANFGSPPDRFSTWACPYSFIQFSYAQSAGGPEAISGQFFASEV